MQYVQVNFYMKLILRPPQQHLLCRNSEFESEIATFIFANFLYLSEIQDGEAQKGC